MSTTCRFFPGQSAVFQRNRISSQREMPHLAAGPRFGLAVEMQHEVGLGEQCRRAQDVVADQVLHHAVGMPAGSPSGRPAIGADMLLELRDGAGGFGPVAGIVDARRDLVGEQRAVGRARRTRRRSRRHSRAPSRMATAAARAACARLPARSRPARSRCAGCRRGGRSRPDRRRRARRRAARGDHRDLALERRRRLRGSAARRPSRHRRRRRRSSPSRNTRWPLPS